MAITRKYFLHGLIFHRSRDLPLEREKVFSGTLKKGLSNGLTSGGVPQEHPISLTRQGGDNESTTDALSNQQIEKAYFISPIVDMERLIADMMIWANVTEDELKEKKEIQTTFGETLSWDYLCYVRENPIIWKIPTHILYGEKDNLTAYGTIFEFVQRTNSTLSIMKNGEHWFHTEEQMKFLDEWIIKSAK